MDQKQCIFNYYNFILFNICCLETLTNTNNLTYMTDADADAVTHNSITRSYTLQSRSPPRTVIFVRSILHIFISRGYSTVSDSITNKEHG